MDPTGILDVYSTELFKDFLTKTDVQVYNDFTFYKVLLACLLSLYIVSMSYLVHCDFVYTMKKSF